MSVTELQTHSQADEGSRHSSPPFDGLREFDVQSTDGFDDRLCYGGSGDCKLKQETWA